MLIAITSVLSMGNKHSPGQIKVLVNAGEWLFLLSTASSPGQTNRPIPWEWVQGGSMNHGSLNLGIHAESCATCHDQTECQCDSQAGQHSTWDHAVPG